MSYPLRFLILFHSFISIALAGFGKSSVQLVLYCALDREFSESIIKDFQEETGIRVNTQFDTEANKSVGLFQTLMSEKAKPRCDVHWNNEILATIRLQKAGLLQPYPSPSAKPFPKQFQAADHTWHAFAGRARILLINTDLVQANEKPKSLWDLTDPRWKGKVAMAKPQFGTTATHAACLFSAWGSKKAREFYTKLAANDVILVPGNKQAAEGVGNGLYAVCMTDTDDAMGEVRAGNSVEIIFPDQGNDGCIGTLFIPNTVALIQNCPHPEQGKKLIDYLLSPEVEKKLAVSGSNQIPLNPKVKVEFPPEMQPAEKAQPMEVNFESAAEYWQQSQQFLRDLFAK